MIGLFPGQGSQHPGMGKFLFDDFKETKVLFEEASDTLKIDLKKLIFDGSAEDLQLTHNTQPCLLLVSTATHNVLRNISGVKFTGYAGHSVGEYAALVASQSLRFRDAITAVRARGEAMQSAVPVGKGGMSAVMGVPDEQIQDLCNEAQKHSGLGPIEAANFNCPGQVVISGNKEALEWLEKNFKKEFLSPAPSRIRFIPLKVSAPFHCSMMAPAEKTMRALLEKMEFQNAAVAVVQNVTAEKTTDGDILRENVIRQISMPVRWTESIQTFSKIGHDKFIECGPGQVLAGLNKKILSDSVKTFSINSLEDLKTIEAEVQK
jgi:[acyl-carrier-protein] S-malonyltransferase